MKVDLGEGLNQHGLGLFAVRVEFGFIATVDLLQVESLDCKSVYLSLLRRDLHFLS